MQYVLMLHYSFAYFRISSCNKYDSYAKFWLTRIINHTLTIDVVNKSCNLDLCENGPFRTQELTHFVGLLMQAG